MAYYYIRKVAGFLVTLFLVSILTFAVFQILPGDPALVILGVDAGSKTVGMSAATQILSRRCSPVLPMRLIWVSWMSPIS